MHSLTLFMLGSAVAAVATVLNPFYVIPLFMFGHFVEPMKWFPELRAYYPSIVLGIVVLAAWLVHLVLFRDFVAARSGQAKIVWLFILCALGATYFGEKANWNDAILYIRTFVPYFIFLYMVKTRKEAKATIWLLLLFGAGAGIYGIYCLKAGIGVSDHGIKRIRSFFGNPNAFGETLTLLVPLAIGLLFYHYPAKVKGILLFILALLVTGVVISYSRKCFFVLIPAIFMIVLKFYKGEKKVFALIGTLLILLLAAYFFPTGAKYRFWKRVRTVFRAESAEKLDAGRTETAKAGWRMMLENPVFGVGLGAFKREYMEIAESAEDIALVGTTRDRSAAGAHNVFVEVGAQMGFVGLGLYLLLVVFAFRDARMAEQRFLERDDGFFRAVAASLQVIIISVMLIGMFTGTLDSKIFWMVVPLSAVIRRLALNEGGDQAGAVV